jgi:murein DD-endopeptidase MepM/ murein hydrolase activator NlpD
MIGLVLACVLTWPVAGSVVGEFAPSGRFGGHWGIDVEAVYGTPVRSPMSGRVVFAGSVAGMRTVSVDGADGLRVSLSYLSGIEVEAGGTVAVGDVLGASGLAHGREAVHISARVDGRYTDPRLLFSCRYDVTAGLRLVEPRPS